MPAPADDYFAFLGYPAERLQLDAAELDQKRIALSRQYHPDRFATKPAAEQQRALEATALLNDAYRTLKDPITRIEHVLERHGLKSERQGSQDVPPALLAEVFELNEALEELRSGDAAVRPQLTAAQAKFGGLLTALDADLQAESARFDAGDAGALPRLRDLLNRRRYIRNLVLQVEHALNEQR